MSTEKALEYLELARRELQPTLGGVTVAAGANLLSLLEQAPAGAVVLVDPGFVLDADVVLTKPVTLRSTLDLGPTRVAVGMRGPTLRGALTVKGPGVSLGGFRLEGQVPTTIVTTGPGTALDRCVVLGSPSGQHRGIRADSDGVKITRCHVGNIWKDQDTQAIAAWDGCANLLVDDCFLEASGENILFGGTDAASDARLPSDILIQHCTLSKPLSWIGKAGLTAKNLLELKACRRVTVRKCVFENSWVNGQVGYAILLCVRNQDNTAPFTTIEDVLIEDCTIRNVVSGVQILGRDDMHPSGVMDRVTLQRNTFEKIGTGWPGGAAGGRQVFITGGPRHLSLLDNTFAGAGLATALTFDNVAFPSVGLKVIGNRFMEGDYGIHGGGAPSLGKAVLDLFAPGYVWERNTLVRDVRTDVVVYPGGTTMVPR